MRNKSSARFNLFSFLVRPFNSKRPVEKKTRRLNLESLEDRELLSLSTISYEPIYGPIYETDVVLKAAENQAGVTALDVSTTGQTDVNLEVQTSTYNNGQILSLTLYASKPISVWEIDWGDGEAPSVYEKLGDSLIVAHSYELQATEQEYVVVATLSDSNVFSDGESYCVAFHTTPAKASEIGDTTTEDSKTTFVTNKFCDAEKSSSSNSNLCWAAGASNALYYTGWASSESLVDASGKSESFESEDDVYSYFADKFDNYGSSALYAYKWFITGEYDGGDISGFALPDENSGGFYTDVDFDDVAEYYSYRSNKVSVETIMPNATEELEQGWAICASLGYYSSSPRGAIRGAHTLSVWGYVCDENYSSDDPEYYTALIVSDPDDSKYYGRSAENKLVTLQIKWSDTYDHYRVTNYSSSYSVWLEEFITLAPRASVTATPNGTTETSADVVAIDAQRRARENCFELLEELDVEEEAPVDELTEFRL